MPWKVGLHVSVILIEWFKHLSLDEILKRDHSNNSYCALLCCGTDYHAVQGSSNF